MQNEIMTAVTAVAVEKFLGPSFIWIKDKLTENGKRAIGKAIEIAKNDVQANQTISLKVVMKFCEEAALVEDDISLSYFGGVLASSRTESSRDDRGATWLQLLGRLSAYDVRAHYSIYQYFKSNFDEPDLRVGHPSCRKKLETIFTIESWNKSIDFSMSEDSKAVTDHIMFNLAKEGLIDPDFRYKFGDNGEIECRPSALGCMLYLWAHGLGETSPGEFFSPKTIMTTDIAEEVVSLQSKQ